MIELLIKGPRKNEIIKSLRKISQSEKQKLHMLRLKAASLKQYRTKQFIEIRLSKQLIQKRKNDLPKHIPVSLINKIQRKSPLTNIEVNNLLKLSPDKKTYESNKKPKFKSYIEDFLPLYYLKQLRDVGHKKLQKISKQSIITVLGQKKQRNFSFSMNKRYLEQKQRTRSVTIGSIQNSDKQLINDLKTQKFVRRIKILHKVQQLTKTQNSQGQIVMNKKLSPSVCVIKKLKTDINQNKKSHYLLKKIRNRQQSKHSRTKQDEIFQQIQIKDKIYPKQFQKSIGPWRNSGLGFKNFQ